MKKLILEHFRCFAEQEINFKKGINLLVGDNATGKTSILKASKYVLSSFFSGFSDENTKWINPDAADFREVIANEGIILPEQPIRIRFNVDDTIEHASLLQTQPELLQTNDTECRYILTKNSKKNSRPLTSGIAQYKSYTQSLLNDYISANGQHRTLPLFASFSTEDIHSSRKINKQKFKAYHQKPSFGYYECLDGDGFFEYWIYRLLILQEGRENHPEITIVRNALKEALGENGCHIIADISIRPIQKKVFFIFADGREIEADYLSDGYRRIINIVIDIAFRCAFLNRGIFGENTCQQTKGTVLIDEVDLHLHPTLQAKILTGLRRAFPQIQFIVTSHAPMVMSGVENNDENVVYKLDYSDGNYTLDEVNTYGLDISTLTDIILHQTPRVKEVDENLSHLFDLIDQDEIVAAKTLFNSLRIRFGENLPELAQAEAMLNCIINPEDEEN